MKVYFISGLGADSRIFCHIQLPAGFEAVFLDWIKPEKEEPLAHYALRLGSSISKEDPFCLLGLSMGGMMAVEIAKHLPPKKLILLSSVATRDELPRYFEYFQKLRLYKFVPMAFIKSASILKRLFTAEDEEDKKLLEKIIHDADPEFLRWGMGAILHWQNREKPGKIWHIHGDHDEILPIKYIEPTYIIPNGTHLMVLNRSKELNSILANILLPDR